jgi:DnaJ-class molecular chaperone
MPFPPSLMGHIIILFPNQIPSVLGPKELKAAFRREALAWHPDKFDAKYPQDPDPAVKAVWEARMKAINEANEVLKIAIEDPSWPHGTCPRAEESSNGGGQRGGGRGTSEGTYTLRVKSFEGTISGLLEGELTPHMVVQQLDTRSVRMNRQVTQLVAGLEIHKTPAHPKYNHHIHFVVEFNSRLYHNSSECVR